MNDLTPRPVQPGNEAAPPGPASQAGDRPSIPQTTELLVAPRPWFERYMFLIGLGLAIIDLALLGLLFLANQPQAVAVLSAIGTMFVAGKEAAIPSGVITLGGAPWLVGSLIWLTDVAAVAMMYPFVQKGLEGAQKTKFLGATLRSAEKRAHKSRKYVDGYGPLGLYLFLIIPFAFNSPVVGIVIGRVTGLKPGRTILAILAGITTTVIGWTLMSLYFGAIVPPKYAWLPLVLSLTATAVALTLGYLAGRKERRLELATETAGQET